MHIWYINKVWIIALCFLPFFIQAQKVKDYNWSKEAPVFEEVPTIFQEEEVVVLKKMVSRSYEYQQGRIFSKEKIRLVYKFQTRKGIQENIRFEIPYNPIRKLSILDARTIKKDGQIVHLESQLLVKEAERQRSKNRIRDNISFLTPAVEVGDIVEIVVVYKGLMAKPNTCYYFQDKLPIMHSMFSLEYSEDLLLEHFDYNQTNPPLTHENVEGKMIIYQHKNVHGLAKESGYLLKSLVPKVCYEVFSKQAYDLGRPKTWLEFLIKAKEDLLLVPIRKPEEIKDFIAQAAGPKAAKPLDKIAHFHHYINQYFQVGPLQKKERGLGLAYLIQSKKIDEFSLTKLYYYFLINEKIPFYYVLGKNRKQGKLDMDFPSDLQVSTYFFTVEDSLKRLYFVHPQTKLYQYDFNELPISYLGNQLLMLKHNDSQQLYAVEAPLMEAGGNQHLRQVKSTISLAQQKIEHECRTVFTGACATEFKQIWYPIIDQDYLFSHLKNSLSFPNSNLNSVAYKKAEDHKPLQFEVKYSLTCDEAITRVTDQLITINLDQWFRHDFIEKEVSAKQFPYTLAYPKLDIFKYYLLFDQPVELVKDNVLNLSLEEGAVHYHFTAQQEDPFTIVLHARLGYIDHKIEADQLATIQAMFEEIRMLTKQPLWLRLLPTANITED